MLTNTSTCDITIGTNQTDTLGGRGVPLVVDTYSVETPDT